MRWRARRSSPGSRRQHRVLVGGMAAVREGAPAIAADIPDERRDADRPRINSGGIGHDPVAASAPGMSGTASLSQLTRLSLIHQANPTSYTGTSPALRALIWLIWPGTAPPATWAWAVPSRD